MEKTLDVTTLTDLQLMKASVDLNVQIQTLSNQYSIVLNEFNRRALEVEAKAADIDKVDPTA